MNDVSTSQLPPRNEFLTARQLAAVLQVSETTVRRLAQKGRIPSVRLTTRILRFHLQSVRDALNDTHHARPRRAMSQDASEQTQLSFSDLL